MLQADGSQGNPCTCLMFMKPTELVKELLVQWIETAEQTEARINQVNACYQALIAKHAWLILHYCCGFSPTEMLMKTLRQRSSLALVSLNQFVLNNKTKLIDSPLRSRWKFPGNFGAAGAVIPFCFAVL